MSNRFAILRVQKLKAAVAVHRSAKHTYREQDTPNADPARTPANEHFGPQGVDGLMQAFNDRKPAKHRKDAVQCIEVFVGASPEAMDAKNEAEQRAYLVDSLDWIKGKFGAENVIGASIHRDETTPHLVAYVVPVDPASGRLNARKWLGGQRALSEMQTDFAANVGLKHDLRRGMEGSKATHKAVRQWYAELGQVAEQAQQSAVPPITPGELEAQKVKGEGLRAKLLGVKETPEDIAKRLTERVTVANTAAAKAKAENAHLKAENTSLRHHLNRMAGGLDLQALRADRWTRMTKNLELLHLIKLQTYADTLRKEVEQEQEQKRQQEEARKAAERAAREQAKAEQAAAAAKELQERKRQELEREQEQKRQQEKPAPQPRPRRGRGR